MSGTANVATSPSRLATKRVVWRSDGSKRTLIVRRAWMAVSLYTDCAPRLPEGDACRGVDGSNQTVGDPRSPSAVL